MKNIVKYSLLFLSIVSIITHNTHGMRQDKCMICLEDEIPEQNFCRLSCSHSYCKNCLTRMADATIEEKDASLLRCPHLPCRNKIKRQDIQIIINNNENKMKRLANIKGTTCYIYKNKKCLKIASYIV